jgi:hypothetical protein
MRLEILDLAQRDLIGVRCNCPVARPYVSLSA